MGGGILAVEAVVAADEETEVEAEVVTAAAVGTAHLVPAINNRHHPSPSRAASSADPTMASTNVPSVANPIAR